MTEVMVEIREDEVDGGTSANAFGVGIHAQGDNLEDRRALVKDAADGYFNGSKDAPRIRLRPAAR